MSKENEQKIDWKQLLKDRKAFCYIKTNRYVHDSGFRCFEVGYCTLTDDGMRTKDKLILNKYSDHFWHKRDYLAGTPPLEFSMDVLLDGYIRIFDHKNILTWENNYHWLVSSFSLEVMED